MSIFNTILNEQNRCFENPEKTVFDYLLAKELEAMNERIVPFHVDCSKTKERICYCDNNNYQLMPLKEKDKFSATVKYLNNYYNGIDDEDYKFMHRKKVHIEERVKHIPIVEDLLSYVPKSRTGKTQKAAEGLSPQQKAEDPAPKTTQQECHYCKSTTMKKFYFIQPHYAEILVCHDCALKRHPDIMNPSQFLRKKKKTKMFPRSSLSTKPVTIKKEESPVPYDKVCNFLHCKSTDEEDLLVCKKCRKAFHSYCFNPPLNKKLVTRVDWFCTECKLCTHCNKTNNEHKLLICDCCDRAYHLSCLDNKMTEVPEGDWYCKECNFCLCGQKLFEALDEETRNKLSNRIFQKYLCCEGCCDSYNNKEYCPICMKLIPRESEGNFILCDACQLWIHAECEGVNSKQRMKEISQLSKYYCTRCKAKRI